MNRRELRKMLPVAATSHLNLNSREVGAGFAIHSKRKVILVINEDVMPANVLDNAFKDFSVEVVVCPVLVPEGQKIDDVIRVYEMPQ